MQPADPVGGMSREKARERIDLVLSSMDTIPLYMTAAALWKSKNDTTLYQPDYRLYAECGRILAEDVLYEPQEENADRDLRIGVMVSFLSELEDEELKEVTPWFVRVALEARQREQAKANEEAHILQFPGCC